MLENDDLRDVDQTILSYMDDGRVTPVYCKKRLSDDGMDYSRGYVQERLSGSSNTITQKIFWGLDCTN